MHYACAKNYFKMVQFLFKECHVNVLAQDKNNYTALHFAGRNGDLDTIFLLVKEHFVNGFAFT